MEQIRQDIRIGISGKNFPQIESSFEKILKGIGYWHTLTLPIIKPQEYESARNLIASSGRVPISEIEKIQSFSLFSHHQGTVFGIFYNKQSPGFCIGKEGDENRYMNFALFYSGIEKELAVETDAKIMLNTLQNGIQFFDYVKAMKEKEKHGYTLPFFDLFLGKE